MHVDGVAGCLLEGSVQACLQVEGHIQEVGYFDVDLGGNAQVVLRSTFKIKFCFCMLPNFATPTILLSFILA